MTTASTGGLRLVRCPKCLNVLPEPPNVTVYRCGGCDTTLRAKIRVHNGQHVAIKQVRQDSDNFSVANSVSNGVPQNKDPVSNGAAMYSSCAPDAPSSMTEHETYVTKSNDNCDVMSAEKNALEVENAESKEDHSFDGHNTVVAGNGKHKDYDKEENKNVEKSAVNSEACRVREDGDMKCSLNASEHNVPLSEVNGLAVNSEQNGECETGLVVSNTVVAGNGKHIDYDKEENNNVEKSAVNSEAYRVREDGDMKCSLNASEHNVPLSEVNGLAVDSEQNGECETELAVSKRGHLVRVQSRSCDLRDGHSTSVDSLVFHSARTSLQSKSFRASEPLQSKIMKTVDELRGDLSEFFSKPSDSKPRAHPPRPLKQEGHVPRVSMKPKTSSMPLTAYHPAAKHSGHAARLVRSGQVAPRGLPSPRYRRHRAHSCCCSEQMETRPFTHKCCHSCHHCHSSWKQEPAPQKPTAKEMKRRPPPRHHCRPVLRGAPFVVCSNCLRLVQLPTDFAVPSKGTRRLKCGSCSEVLSYSYRDPSTKKLKSPFGGDEYSTDDYEIHQTADDRHNGGFHQAEPYSYSEEYGLSPGVSYSTEDEQPLHVSRNSSFNTIDERNGKDSKLHRLMGYSSASELLWHSPDLYESFHGRTPPEVYDRKGKAICVAGDDSGGEDSAVKRSKARGIGAPLHGILKKGIHGLESLKLRS